MRSARQRASVLLSLALALGGTGAGCLHSRAESPTASSSEWFTEEAEARGLRLPTEYRGKRPLNIRQTAGAGVALFDFDDDGGLDVFLVGREEFNPGGRGALFRNRGDGTFENRTEGSGLDVPGLWHGCAVGDYDNDGRSDLLLTGFGDCRLFRNLGHGRFRDVTLASGLEVPSKVAWATSAAFGDVNRDGLADLYIGRYVRFTSRDLQLCNYRGVAAACGPKSYDPQYGSLYLNRGGGKFEDVTRSWGLEHQEGKTLGVTFGDANGDRFPDLYLANDEVPGNLYLNLQGKRFREAGAASGTAGSATGEVQGGMGVDWGDYSGDGLQDLFVATFQFEDHSLYRNLGSGLFEHVSRASGLGESTRAFVGFGARLADFDRDGRLDVMTANGHIQDNVREVDASASYAQRLQFFRNLDGSRFAEVGPEAGKVFERPIVGRGLAVGDVDNDGDPDAVVTDLEGPPVLLINRSGGGAHWISVRLVGRKSNRMGLGAVVRARTGDLTQVRESRTCGSYLSSQDPRLLFGLGRATRVDLEVQWPSGRMSKLRGVAVDQQVTVTEEG